MSKQKIKSKPKATQPKKPAEENPHKCGEYNAVMGKGSFTKIGDRFSCLECGAELDALPEEWVKANPEGAKLLLKGQKNENHTKSPIMVEAGKKAWRTRLEHQNQRKAEAQSSKSFSPKNAA